MKPLRQVAACTALALCAAVAPARAADWTLLQSEHFSLYTQRDDAELRADLQQLEVFRWMALKVLGADELSVRAQGRFEVYMLDGRRSLSALYPGLGEAAWGMYTYCADGAIAYGTRDGRLLGGQDWNLIVLQHEYAHHLMFQYATLTYPAWFVEGFAEYMSTAVFEEGRLSVGDPNAVRAAEVDRGGALSYEEVLRWHLRSAKDRKGNDRYPFYAQSWLLAHYMLGDDERAKRLAAYFVRIGAGEEPVAAFEAATGIAVGDLPKLLRQYRRNMLALRVKSDDMPRSTIQALSLGKDADAYLLTASQLRCTTPDRAQPLLARLRTLAPDPSSASPGLRLALASAEARFGDVASAIAMLDAHVAADADSAEAHYLLGRAWTRRAQALPGDEQAAAYAHARRHLFQAYRLRKGDAPTLYHLARALSRDGANPNALNAARGARALAPAVREYAVLEAQLDLLAGDRERAVRALGPLASDPHHADMAASMRQAIEAIRAGKSLEDLMALMNPAPRKPKE